MGLVGAGLFVLLVVSTTCPFWLALAVALVVRHALRRVVELIVIRRLFDAPRVIVLVATIGIAQLPLASSPPTPTSTVRGAPFPLAIGAMLRRSRGVRDHRRRSSRSWSWCRSSPSRSAGS